MGRRAIHCVGPSGDRKHFKHGEGAVVKLDLEALDRWGFQVRRNAGGAFLIVGDGDELPSECIWQIERYDGRVLYDRTPSAQSTTCKEEPGDDEESDGEWGSPMASYFNKQPRWHIAYGGWNRLRALRPRGWIGGTARDDFECRECKEYNHGRWTKEIARFKFEEFCHDHGISIPGHVYDGAGELWFVVRCRACGLGRNNEPRPPASAA